MHGSYRKRRHGQLSALLALISVVLLAGCNVAQQAWDFVFPPGPAVYVEQGWTPAQRTFFYYTTQGSRLIPRDWFLALERHDSNDRFLDDGLKRFGYLPGEHNIALNPDTLPVGFAVDRDSANRGWIGMTCAACHTSDVRHGSKVLRIDGAPAEADMYEFISKLGLALKKTADDDPKFLRFAAKVLGANNSPANRLALKNDLTAFANEFATFVTQSTPASPWGPARLDAFGMIFNRVTGMDLGLVGNIKPPDAPVSYPFLWGTSWHDFTQWNGAVKNGGLLGPAHRLGRNVGQVLGVFGTINLTSGPPYSSSVHLVNLGLLEETVKTLKAPPWPSDVLGAPDSARVTRGATLYQSTCIVCHRLVAPDQQLRSVNVTVQPASVLGTDPTMTTMVATRMASSGVLQGRPLSAVIPSRALGANELSHDLVTHAVIGAVFGGFTPSGVPGTIVPTAEGMFDASVTVGNYKARPLNGIWATGPYLHNGSVRTLYQLLLPEAQRESRFFVGSRKFDPDGVGFKDEPGTISFKIDTSLPGNSNKGHLYGTTLTDDQRKDLVEYLKTL